ncbi:MAG: PepSY-associated TM helix domain-containing protein [Vicinamibacterales bacterium]
MLRKALFQIHSWAGIGVGLYVLVVSLTGSLLVFRQEYYAFFRPGSTLAPQSGERMTVDALTEAAERLYPGAQINRVIVRRRGPQQAADVYLERDGQSLHRLFDPYTGADLGDAEPPATRLFEQVVDLHDNLFAGRRGRLVNGVGALCLTLLCLSGAVIWWQGGKTWYRGLLLRWRVNWKRLNWDLHSALGFWSLAFIFMWAVSGVYLVFPEPFNQVVDFLQPPTEDAAVRAGDDALAWLARLHFGRFAGLKTKMLWGTLGLVPPVLFITGGVIWWNRVIRRSIRQAE